MTECPNDKVVAYLYNIDEVIWSPKECEGTNDDEDEAASSAPALEHGTAQAADNGGVTAHDEAEW